MVAGQSGEDEQQLRFVATGQPRQGGHKCSGTVRSEVDLTHDLLWPARAAHSHDLYGFRWSCVWGDHLEFEQTRDVVSARYRGGTIADGYLVGKLDPTGTSLRFCYVQADLHGNVDAGSSTGTIDELQDGRLRLTEVFQWFTRPGRGTNVFEEIRDTGEAI